MLLLAFLLVVGCQRGPAVIIRSAQGPVTVHVEVVDTPDTRARGLMYRRDLAADAGMLFVFEAESDQHFWMKNTPLPLDMIFIGANHKIVGIVADTRPFTTNSQSVGTPSQYVVEVHAGFCAAHRIATGDSVEFVRVANLG